MRDGEGRSSPQWRQPQEQVVRLRHEDVVLLQPVRIPLHPLHQTVRPVQHHIPLPGHRHREPSAVLTMARRPQGSMLRKAQRQNRQAESHDLEGVAGSAHPVWHVLWQRVHHHGGDLIHEAIMFAAAGQQHRLLAQSVRTHTHACHVKHDLSSIQPGLDAAAPGALMPLVRNPPPVQQAGEPARVAVWVGLLQLLEVVVAHADLPLRVHRAVCCDHHVVLVAQPGDVAVLCKLNSAQSGPLPHVAKPPALRMRADSLHGIAAALRIWWPSTLATHTVAMLRTPSAVRSGGGGAAGAEERDSSRSCVWCSSSARGWPKAPRCQCRCSATRLSNANVQIRVAAAATRN